MNDGGSRPTERGTRDRAVVLSLPKDDRRRAGSRTPDAAHHSVRGVALLALLLTIAFLWNGGRISLVAFWYARYGLLNVPALTIGGLSSGAEALWALAAGTLNLDRPQLPVLQR
jgi:hypothetical protein